MVVWQTGMWLWLKPHYGQTGWSISAREIFSGSHSVMVINTHWYQRMKVHACSYDTVANIVHQLDQLQLHGENWRFGASWYHLFKLLNDASWAIYHPAFSASHSVFNGFCLTVYLHPQPGSFPHYIHRGTFQ